MKTMLRAELYRFAHGRLLWIVAGVLTAGCGISIVTGTYASAENALANLSKDCMSLILACAVYGAILLTEDRSSGLARYYAAWGCSRRAIAGAKLFHYLLGCTLLLLLYPLASVCLAAAVQGTEGPFGAVLAETLRIFLRTLPLYWGIFGLFFLISFLTASGAAAMGICLAVSILGVVLTNKLAPAAPGLFRLSPVVQIQEAAQGRLSGAYLPAVVLALAAFALCFLLSAAKFSREEL